MCAACVCIICNLLAHCAINAEIVLCGKTAFFLRLLQLTIIFISVFSTMIIERSITVYWATVIPNSFHAAAVIFENVVTDVKTHFSSIPLSVTGTKMNCDFTPEVCE